jgi:hypothetical protein
LATPKYTPRTNRSPDTPAVFQDFARYRRTPYFERTPRTPQSGSSRTRYEGYQVEDGSTYQQNPQYLQLKQGYSSLAQRSLQDTSDYNKLRANTMGSVDPVDKKISAIQNLVGELHSDMRRSDELLSYPRAKKFVEDRNAPFLARGQPAPYNILAYQDYDGDNVPDTIIGRNNKIYSYNGFRPKDSDHALRAAYYVEHPEGPYR